MQAERVEHLGEALVIGATVTAASAALPRASRPSSTSSGITASLAGLKKVLAMASRVMEASISAGLEMAYPQIPRMAIGTSASRAARKTRCLGRRSPRLPARGASRMKGALKSIRAHELYDEARASARAASSG
jgi:hypothetical protein